MADADLMVGKQMLFTVGTNQHVNGTIKYVGRLAEDPTDQQWVGVELDEAVGRHSGRHYFSCAPKHGLFVKAATAVAASVCSDTGGRMVEPQMGPLFSRYFAGMEAAAFEAGVKLCTPPAQPLDVYDALLIIDMQYDFLPGGAFGVPEGNDILQPLAGLISAGAAAGATMICTRDYHPHDHASFNTQGGPFPPHCLQGGRGSKLCPPIANAMSSARKAYPGLVDIVFKGWHKHVDSFGAFEYSNGLAQGRLVHRQPEESKPCSFLSFTGACQLRCSSLHEDINAPPDVLSADERISLAERLGKRRSLFILGLALDFCVCDTSLTAREAGYENVYIVLDVSASRRHLAQPSQPESNSLSPIPDVRLASQAARPSHVPPIGFLTPPPDLFRKAHDAGVKFCLMADMFPRVVFGKE